MYLHHEPALQSPLLWKKQRTPLPFTPGLLNRPQDLAGHDGMPCDPHDSLLAETSSSAQALGRSAELDWEHESAGCSTGFNTRWSTDFNSR